MAVGWQGSGWFSATRAESSAAADTMLKDMPGATLPVSVLPSSGSGIDPVWWDASTRMSPLRVSTATISPEPDCAARAVAAACWSVLLSVVCSVVPGWPGASHSVATVAPAEFTTTIEVVGVPTRASW